MKDNVLEQIRDLLEAIKSTSDSFNKESVIDQMKQILKEEKDKKTLSKNRIKKIDDIYEFLEKIKNPPTRAIIEFCEAQVKNKKKPFQNVIDFYNGIELRDSTPITTVNDFLNKVKLHENSPGFFKIFFRGHSKEEFKFIPSVFRDQFLGFEQEIYYEVLRECSFDFTTKMSELEILVKMQHYGVPTRVLDVTTNPLVALYFACCANLDRDGAVWIIPTNTNRILNFDDKILNWISCLPKKKTDELSSIFTVIDFIQLTILIHQKKIELPEEVLNVINECSELEEFKYSNLCQRITEINPILKIIFPSLDEVLDINDPPLLHANIYSSNYFFSRFKMKYLFYPKKSNPRIVAQQGAFIIFSGDGKIIEDNSHTYGSCRSNDYRSDYFCTDDYSDKIIIPAFSKIGILDELEFIGISKATLFPELDRFSEYIKDKYILRETL